MAGIALRDLGVLRAGMMGNARLGDQAMVSPGIIAQEAAAIFAFMPEVEKRAKLREVEQINPVMANLIRKEMDEVHKQKNRDFIAQGGGGRVI